MSLYALVLYFIFYIGGIYGPPSVNEAIIGLFFLMASIGYFVILLTRKPPVEQLEGILFISGIAAGGIMLWYFYDNANSQYNELYHSGYMLGFIALLAWLGTRADKRAAAQKVTGKPSAQNT